MARPTNSSKAEELALKEEFEHVSAILNQLEEICESPSDTIKQEYGSLIGYLVGKMTVRVLNIMNMLDIND